MAPSDAQELIPFIGQVSPDVAGRGMVMLVLGAGAIALAIGPRERKRWAWLLTIAFFVTNGLMTATAIDQSSALRLLVLFIEVLCVVYLLQAETKAAFPVDSVKQFFDLAGETGPPAAGRAARRAP